MSHNTPDRFIKCKLCGKIMEVLDHVWKIEPYSPKEGVYSTWYVPYPSKIEDGIPIYGIIHGVNINEAICNECIKFIGDNWKIFFEDLREYRCHKRDYHKSILKMNKWSNKIKEKYLDGQCSSDFL